MLTIGLIETDKAVVENFFKTMTSRSDVGIILINQHVRLLIKYIFLIPDTVREYVFILYKLSAIILFVCMGFRNYLFVNSFLHIFMICMSV